MSIYFASNRTGSTQTLAYTYNGTNYSVAVPPNHSTGYYSADQYEKSNLLIYTFQCATPQQIPVINPPVVQPMETTITWTYSSCSVSQSIDTKLPINNADTVCGDLTSVIVSNTFKTCSGQKSVCTSCKTVKNGIALNPACYQLCGQCKCGENKTLTTVTRSIDVTCPTGYYSTGETCQRDPFFNNFRFDKPFESSHPFSTGVILADPVTPSCSLGSTDFPGYNNIGIIGKIVVIDPNPNNSYKVIIQPDRLPITPANAAAPPYVQISNASQLFINVESKTEAGQVCAFSIGQGETKAAGLESCLSPLAVTALTSVAIAAGSAVATAAVAGVGAVVFVGATTPGLSVAGSLSAEIVGSAITSTSALVAGVSVGLATLEGTTIPQLVDQNSQGQDQDTISFCSVFGTCPPGQTCSFKDGNNSTVSCDTFCQDPAYGGISFPFCAYGLDNKTQQPVDCGQSSSDSTNNWSCSCFTPQCDKPKCIVKDGNNGTATGDDFCHRFDNTLYNTCVDVYDNIEKRNYGCDEVYKPGTTALTNWSVSCATPSIPTCSDCIIKNGNNGTKSGNDFCKQNDVTPDNFLYDTCAYVYDNNSNEYYDCNAVYKPGTGELTNWSVACKKQ